MRTFKTRVFVPVQPKDMQNPSNRYCFVTLILDLPDFIELLGWQNILAAFLATWKNPCVRNNEKITLTTSECFSWWVNKRPELFQVD